MGKDKVVIFVVVTIVLSAILFGLIMAYRIYKLPMVVDDINETINMLKDSSNEDEHFRMNRLSMFYELSRSYKMKERKTNQIRKFTKEEMDEIYKSIGGKEKVINYLKSIEDDDKRREELNFARNNLKIITDEELSEIWYIK